MNKELENTKSLKLEKVSDFNQWLEKGIDSLSKDFYDLVPKEVAYQYIDRVKEEGWLETVWDYLEALRAFRLYFIIFELENQIGRIAIKTRSDVIFKEGNQLRHILRDFSESTVKLHKALSETLERAGLSKVANKGLADSGKGWLKDLMKNIEEEEDADTTNFDLELKIHKEKKAKRQLKQNKQDENQSNIFGDDIEMTEAEFDELSEIAITDN